MRTLVPPAPSKLCEKCGGELQLKQIDPNGPATETDIEIFVCIKCAHQQSFRVSHDIYTPSLPDSEPPAKVG